MLKVERSVLELPYNKNNGHRHIYVRDKIKSLSFYTSSIPSLAAQISNKYDKSCH